MSDESPKNDLATKAAIAAGAAIGSAAVAAALLYVKKRRAKDNTAPAPHPEQAPETD